MRGLSNILRLGVKELRGLRADPVLLLLMVYAFSLSVYVSATGMRMEVRNAAVAVVDEDRSALSRSITAALLPPQFRPPVAIPTPEVARAMDAGRQVFVLEIPPRFEANLLSGRGSAVLLNVDATAMSQAGNGAAYIQQAIMDAVGARAGVGPVAPVQVVMRVRFNPNLQAERFASVMQLINMITMLSLILPGAAMLRERDHGTLEHLLAMPVTPIEILLAKLWANALVIVVAASLSLLLVVRLLLGVPLVGSPPLFLAGTALYQVSVAALGMLLANATRSMGQFGLATVPVLMVMILLSGSNTPLESMPDWLQWGVMLSPARHFVAFAQGVLYRGAGFAMVWHHLAALAVLGGSFVVIALADFRRALARAG